MHWLDQSFGNLENLKVVIGGTHFEDHWCKWLLHDQLCELHKINTANASSVKWDKGLVKISALCLVFNLIANYTIMLSAIS